MRERLSMLNDPILRPLIDACDESAREAALASIIGQTTPTIRKLLHGYIHPRGELQPEDADEVTSAVTLRLVKKLRACARGDAEPIERLPHYVARQTFNAIYDVLRRRFPARMRLKSRLRYVLTHDPRLALWNTPAGLTAGLARFRDTPPQSTDLSITRFNATRTVFDRERPANAVVELLTRIERPILFELVVRTFAELWNITDVPSRALQDTDAIDACADPHERIEKRQYLQNLWSEIRDLREQQRAALLLNLREVGGANGLTLFILAGIASLDQIAEALSLTTTRLAEIWRDLPLDDLTIAGMLGLERQQVINLRKAARSRLLRRMSLDRQKLSQ